MAETLRKIICYGDSNTFGYDPRCFLGDRYPEERIWTTLLENALNAPDPAAGCSGCRFEIINRGMNGRKIPAAGWGYRYVESILDGLAPSDFLVIMLGSNDIFMTDDPDAGIPVDKMDELLRWLTERENCPGIILIAPPYPDEEDLGGGSGLMRYVTQSKVMNRGFRKLAEHYGTEFADASGWGIEAAFDGVHFTEEGHAVFAARLTEMLQEILNKEKGKNK